MVWWLSAQHCMGGEPCEPAQNILLVGGGGGGLSSRPGQEVTHGTLHTSIRTKELSARHQFSGSQDAHNTSLDLIITCPRSHFHTGRTVIVIALIGITVYYPWSMAEVQNKVEMVTYTYFDK